MKKRGFTLIELMVVLAIVAILGLLIGSFFMRLTGRYSLDDEETPIETIDM